MKRSDGKEKQAPDETNVTQDFEDPHIYSTTEPFYPISFLRVNGANTVPEEERKFLPEAHPPSFLSDEEVYSLQLTDKDAIFKHFSLAVDKDGLKMVDEKLIKTQKSFIATLLSKMGKSLFSANTIGLSLPARMTEPRSIIDGFADFLRLTCTFLKRAATHPDKLERIKLVTAGFISSIHLLMRNKKPFNPLLGETLQYTLEDGTEVCGEQISHHPPISYYYVVGPKKSYTLCGNFSLDPTFKGYYILIKMDLKFTIKFKDGHTYIVHKRPNMKIAGILSDTRRVLVKGPLIIEDKTLKLWSASFFDYGEKKGIISSEKTIPKNECEGIIYVSKNVNGPNRKARRIADLDDVAKELTRLKGSWLDKLEINSVNYWDIAKAKPMKIIYNSDPLASDWRYREDLIFIRRGDLDNADKWKDALEIRQRRDKKLRVSFMAKEP
eukprot:TRINITY_DN7088_c0_g2_i2.p1 TRINITY_DN7088_c0_g2~~TRINITY_DN7088_c0_g2_i2.p1  ORF type:complete len:439 (+),score=126.82 TRINITY_DN7088_c0_g2_i2:96-1412(+)